MIRCLQLMSRLRATPLHHQVAKMGPEETEAFGSTPSCSPSQSPARKQIPDHPETQYCLEIQVTLAKDREIAPPPSHTWQVSVVEDMLWDGKSGLTEVVVTGPGQAVLFYRRQSLGEWLHLGKAWDIMFTLSGAISWVGKQAQFNTNPVSPGEGWQLIVQAITEQCIEPRGPRCPHCILPVSPPFSFHSQCESPQGMRLLTVTEQLEVPGHNHQALYHDWGQALQCSWEHGHRWWDLRATLPPIAVAITRLWVQEYPKLSVNFFFDVI